MLIYQERKLFLRRTYLTQQAPRITPQKQVNALRAEAPPGCGSARRFGSDYMALLRASRSCAMSAEPVVGASTLTLLAPPRFLPLRIARGAIRLRENGTFVEKGEDCLMAQSSKAMQPFEQPPAFG